jgi:GNAT superfamily N-acetyltransferase
MATWTIRSAEAADIDAVLAFWRGSDAVPSSTDYAAALTVLITETSGLLLAERAGTLIGTLIATWDGWRGNMYRLVVDQRARRQGLARALVTAGEQRLARRAAGGSARSSPMRTTMPWASGPPQGTRPTPRRRATSRCCDDPAGPLEVPQLGRGAQSVAEQFLRLCGLARVPCVNAVFDHCPCWDQPPPIRSRPPLSKSRPTVPHSG